MPPQYCTCAQWFVTYNTCRVLEVARPQIHLEGSSGNIVHHIERDAASLSYRLGTEPSHQFVATVLLFPNVNALFLEKLVWLVETFVVELRIGGFATSRAAIRPRCACIDEPVAQVFARERWQQQQTAQQSRQDKCCDVVLL